MPAVLSARWLLEGRRPLSAVRLYAVASAGITLLVVVRVWYYPQAAPFSIGWIPVTDEVTMYHYDAVA